MDLDKIITSLEVATPVAKALPVAGVGLGAMLEVATQVCKSARSAKTNREAYGELAKEVAGYASAVSRAVQSDTRFSLGSRDASDPHQEDTMKEIEQLTSIFDEVVEAIKSKQTKDDKRQRKPMGPARQLGHETWHKAEDERRVKELGEKMKNSVKWFHIGVDIRGLDALRRIENNTWATAAEMSAIEARHIEESRQVRLRREQEAMERESAREAAEAHQAHTRRQLLRQEQDFIEQKLAPVHTARFDGNGTPTGCLSNTRVKLQEQVCGWITDNSESSPDVFFLTGLAGTGKTTVAQSVCIHFDRERPTVSFFASRSSANRRSPERILQSIVYQIGAQNEAVQLAIASALRNGRNVTTRPLSEQVETLFTGPLRAMESPKLPVLIVIDALDECDKVADCEGGDLIPLLVSAMRELPGQVKLLVTSREEPTIMAMLRDMDLHTPQSLIRLHNIEDSVVKADIETFYGYHFHLIAKRRRFQGVASWPSKPDFDLVVERTGKLFVYAALVVRLVSVPRGNPKQTLEEILRLLPTSASDDVFQELDKLYLSVLEKATTTGVASLDKKVVERIRRVIGTLLLLQTPLNARTLSELLGEDMYTIQEDIEHLSAVLVVPDDAESSITIFHPSFPDFIYTRCSDERFRLDPADYNAYLARCCLVTMNGSLKRDICDIKDPSIMNKDIEDLEQRCNRSLPHSLQYACEYWAVHLSHASHSEEELAKKLDEFCNRHLLHWVEALSVMGRVSAGQRYVSGAIGWCKKRGSMTLIMTSLLENVERVLQVYDAPIQASGLQVYGSALAFMPECKLYESGRHDIMGRVRPISERLKRWPALLRTIEGHSKGVMCVAYSPDGTRIASGSWDNSVRLWDATAGHAIAQLQGHAGPVNSVAFSPDGTRIVSGSNDSTLRVWDVISGYMIAQLHGHTSWVTSVAFSPDGTRIASGSNDKTVRVWDAVAGRAIAELQGHIDWVCSVAFSPNGTHIASGSCDEIVRVWDAIAGHAIAKFQGHSKGVSSVAFSLDGTRIASGSEDRTLRVWSAISRRTIAQLRGHAGPVNSVAFSPDGTRIVSGSNDGTARVWDAISGHTIAELQGHTDQVNSVAFSPDGTRIASGSWDKSVGVWDAISGRSIAELQGHTDRVNSVAFSPDRTRIASGSFDETVRVWDAITGRAISQLHGHIGPVTFVSFSNNGTEIVSKDRYNNQRVWYEGQDFPTNYTHPPPLSYNLNAGSPSINLSFDYKSGWLTTKQPHSQPSYLCWIPPERRGTFWVLDSGDVVVLTTSRGLLTILSISPA